jgi:hypothetical protein
MSQHAMPETVQISDLHHLQGKSVLLKSASERHFPTVGIRGTIEVPAAEKILGTHPSVTLVWEVPDMFEVPAHRRTVTLRDDRSIRKLLASEREGTFEFTIDRELD